MPAFKFVAELMTRRKFKGLSQTQDEALVDVLTAAKAIDGQLRDVEREELMRIMEKLDWNGTMSMAAYVEDSIERATKIEVIPAELERFFDDIGDRLEEDWLREEAYYLASRIVLADDQIMENERLLLKYMVKGFGISADKQQLIIRKIRGEIGMI